jgi:hypothetical protein
MVVRAAVTASTPGSIIRWSATREYASSRVVCASSTFLTSMEPDGVTGTSRGTSWVAGREVIDRSPPEA